MPAPEFTIHAVCQGNICRSPMAAAVLRQQLADADLPAPARVASSGVTAEEQGNPIDPRAARSLARRGYLVDRSHRAHRITRQELDTVDLILPSTFYQLEQLLRLGAGAERVKMIRQFDSAFEGSPPGRRLDLEDPWYGTQKDFETALDQIEAAAPGVVEYLRERLAG
jgi:protein-tyrosine phosphatase